MLAQPVYNEAEESVHKILSLDIHIFLTSLVLRGIRALSGSLDSQTRFHIRMNTHRVRDKKVCGKWWSGTHHSRESKMHITKKHTQSWRARPPSQNVFVIHHATTLFYQDTPLTHSVRWMMALPNMGLQGMGEIKNVNQDLWYPTCLERHLPWKPFPGFMFWCDVVQLCADIKSQKLPVLRFEPIVTGQLDVPIWHQLTLHSKSVWRYITEISKTKRKRCVARYVTKPLDVRTHPWEVPTSNVSLAFAILPRQNVANPLLAWRFSEHHCGLH